MNYRVIFAIFLVIAVASSSGRHLYAAETYLLLTGSILKQKGTEEKKFDLFRHFVVIIAGRNHVIGYTDSIVEEVSAIDSLTFCQPGSISFVYNYQQKSPSPLLETRQIRRRESLREYLPPKESKYHFPSFENPGIFDLAIMHFNVFLQDSASDWKHPAIAALRDGRYVHQGRHKELTWSVDYRANRSGLTSIDCQGWFESATCVFDQPLIPFSRPYRANVTVTKCKVPELDGRYLISVDRVSSSPQDCHNAILQLKSKFTKKLFLERLRGESVAKRWNGTEFEDFVNANVSHQAATQTLVVPPAKAPFPWAWLAVGVIAVVAIVGSFVWHRSRKAAAVLLATVILPSAGRADEGAYCGLFCVHAAAAAMEKPVEFESIRKAEFLNAKPGSTTNDLVRALATAGLTGTPQNRITVHELRHTATPVILHARSPGARNYYHWIVYLGRTADGHAAIFDPSGGRSEIAFAELMPVWDGYGIVVTDGRPGLRLPVAPEWILLTMFAGGTYFLAVRRFPRWLAFAIAAGLSAALWHSLAPQGFVHSRRALGTTTSTFFDLPIPECDHGEFSKLRDGGAVVLDARTVEQFRAMHIAGAKLLPITSSLLELRRAFETMDPAVPVVCYCNSHQCAWSDVVANQLLHSGYRHVSVYRGGLAEWSAKGGPIGTEATP
jgi:rhodanese-related sulfurtransferase